MKAGVFSPRLATVSVGVLVALGLTAFDARLDAQERYLRFEAPLDGSHFKVGVEVPVVLTAHAADDVYGGASVFVDGAFLAVATFCCPLCPCAHPTAGITTTLQIPATPGEINPGGPVWKGWIPPGPGKFVLTASASGENGTSVEAPPVTVIVEALDLTLRVNRGVEGEVVFALGEGSLMPGGFEMQLSHDLTTWMSIGMFEPGNVAAFFRDKPDPADTRPRYYRAVSLPPR